MVVPNHNRGDLLGEAVRSALSQDGVEVEVLVCDDGSTDHSALVVQEINDSRVRWLPAPASGGPAVPRNRGIAAAKGEWVAFLDSDDRWLPGKLAAQMQRLDATGADACTTNAFRCIPGRRLPADLMHDHLPGTVTLTDQLLANLVITSSMLVRTRVLRQVGGFPEVAGRKIFEDYALWLRLAQLAPIAVLDEPWVEYRDDAGASHRGTMAPDLTCAARALRDFVHWRRRQADPIRTTGREVLVMARQLAGLVAVRDFVRRGLRLLTQRSSHA